MLAQTIGQWVSNRRDAVARLLIRLRVTPNELTIIGFLVTCSAGYSFAVWHPRSAVIIIIFASAFDMLDGAVARISGKVSKFGAVLDSSLDRYSDAVLFGGLMIHYINIGRSDYVLLSGAAMVGALLTSYVRARAERVVPLCKVGFWERAERIVYLMGGALLGCLPAALWVLAILTNVTVIQRICYTWQQTSRRPKKNEHEVDSSGVLASDDPSEQIDLTDSESTSADSSSSDGESSQLGDLLLWKYGRGSWQYDVAVVLSIIIGVGIQTLVLPDVEISEKNPIIEQRVSEGIYYIGFHEKYMDFTQSDDLRELRKRVGKFLNKHNQPDARKLYVVNEYGTTIGYMIVIDKDR